MAPWIAEKVRIYRREGSFAKMDRTLSQGPTTASMHKWSIFKLILYTFWCTSRVSVGPIAVFNFHLRFDTCD